MQSTVHNFTLQIQKFGNKDGKVVDAKFLDGRQVATLDDQGNVIKDADGKPVMETSKGFDTVTEAFDSLGKTDQGLADALGGGTTINVDGTITGPTYEITNKDGDQVTVNNVGDALTTIDNSVTNITSGKAGLVQLSDDNKTIVIDNELAKDATSFNIAGTNAERKLTGVAEGDVNKGSVDAINGSQLYAANKNIADTLGNAVTINAETGAIEGAEFLAGRETPKLDADGKPVLDADGKPVMEVVKGFETVTDAFNSLGAADQALVDALGGGATVNVDGSITGPNYKDVLGADKDLNNVEDGFGYVKDQLTGITSGTAGLFVLSDDGDIVVNDAVKGADQADFNLASKDGSARQLTGVKAGEVSATSKEAINGSQLFDVSTSVAETLGGTASVDKDGKVVDAKFLDGRQVATLDDQGNVIKDADGKPVMETSKGFETVTEAFDSLGKTDQGLADALGGGTTINIDGTITGPTYEITNKDGDQVTVNNVGDALTTIDNSVTNITSGKAGLVKLDANGQIVIDNAIKGADKAIFNLANQDGSARKLTGVAKGEVSATSVDAINGSQLYAANKNIADTLGDAVTINADTGAIESAEFLAGRETPKLDAEGKPVLDADGKPVMEAVKGFETVTDAFNSLGAADQALVDALGGGATVNVDGSITGPTYNINNGDTYHNVGDAITNIDGRVIDNSTKIEDITNNITTGKAGLVQLKDIKDDSGKVIGQEIVIDNTAAKDAKTFDISNNDGAVRTLKGLEEGAITKTSTEAINGAQIYEIGHSLVQHLDPTAKLNDRGVFDGLNFQEALKADKKIGSVYEGFEYLNEGIVKGEMGLLQMSKDEDGNDKLVFSDVAKKATEFDVSGENGVAMKVTNVADGAVAADSLDAINGSQLYATNKSIVDSLGGGAELNDDGSITGPTYVINGKNYTNVGDAITNIDGRVIDNTKNITNLTENINNINTGKAGLVMIEGDKIVFDSSIAGGRTFDISNKGQARKMTGVADGTIAAGSKDAVNGGQLHDTNQNVATNTDNIGSLVDSLGGGATVDKDGKVTGPNYTFTDGSSHTNVGSALDNLDGRVNDLDNKVDGITNGTAGLVQLGKDKDGNDILVIDNDLAKDAGTFDISNGEDGRTLTGVADGEIAKGSKDAINGGQLHTSNETIANIFGGGATVDKDGFVSMPEYDFGDKNVFDNVGDSLAHLNNKIQNGEGGLFQMSADGKTVVLGDTASTATTVDMGNRVIAGVANGKVEKDSLEAVNGGQLWTTNQNVAENTNQIKHINNTLNHYNTRINNLEKTVHENRKRASAGTASAMAMSSIPYLDYAKYSFGMGVASYDGEAAMSMGLEFRMGDNGRFRIQGSYDTQNKAGVGVGMAFEL